MMNERLENDESLPATDETTPKDEMTSEEISAEIEEGFKQYNSELAQQLNEDIDKLTANFDHMVVLTQHFKVQLPYLRRMMRDVKHMCLRSEWLLERDEGRRIPAKRSQAMAWEMAYYWQEFKLFLRCHFSFCIRHDHISPAI
jgi:arginyl-tRNA synthetase